MLQNIWNTKDTNPSPVDTTYEIDTEDVIDMR